GLRPRFLLADVSPGPIGVEPDRAAIGAGGAHPLRLPQRGGGEGERQQQEQTEGASHGPSSGRRGNRREWHPAGARVPLTYPGRRFPQSNREAVVIGRTPARNPEIQSGPAFENCTTRKHGSTE